MSGRRVLLVEGPDDREILYQLFNEHGIDNRSSFEVKAAKPEGVEGVLQEFPALIRTGVLTLGIIIDADADPERQWARVRDPLVRLGYSDCPDAPPRDGLVLDARPRRPRVGVWLMPNNDAEGMMEHFLLHLASPDDPLLPLARDAVGRLPSELRRFKESYRVKAELHTWLAWQQEPGTRPGLALTRRYLSHDRPMGDALARWVRQLFQLEAGPLQIG